MNKDQRVHIAMINSYNIITGKAKLEDIVESKVNILAHSPYNDILYENIELIMLYFESIDMYEKCTVLLDYLKENYNEDKSIKKVICECDMPEIKEYTKDLKCSSCNKKIIIE